MSTKRSVTVQTIEISGGERPNLIAELRHRSSAVASISRLARWLLSICLLSAIFLAGVYSGTSGGYKDAIEDGRRILGVASSDSTIFNFLAAIDQSSDGSQPTRDEIFAKIQLTSDDCAAGSEKARQFTAKKFDDLVFDINVRSDRIVKVINEELLSRRQDMDAFRSQRKQTEITSASCLLTYAKLEQLLSALETTKQRPKEMEKFNGQ